MRRRLLTVGLRVVSLGVVCCVASMTAGSSMAAGSAAAPERRYALGAVLEPGREVPETLAAAAAAALPAKVDLTRYAPPAGNQGPVGSCSSWSIGYTMLGWYANRQKQKGAPFAPMYLYSQVNGGRDEGATTRSNFDVLLDQGIARAADYTQGPYDWRKPPTAAQKKSAGVNRIASYDYLFRGDQQGAAGNTAIKKALATEHPVEMVIPVHKAFHLLNAGNNVLTLKKATGKVQGYHAVVAMGYDKTGVVIENSWSPSWGKRGFAVLGWDFVEKYAYEAAVMEGFDDKAAPTVTGIGANVPATGGDLTLTGYGLGGSAKAFAGKKLVATIAGEQVPLTWTSRHSLRVSVGVGRAGETVPLTLRRGGSTLTVPGAAWASVISSIADEREPVSGARMLRVTGAGFTGSSRWGLLTQDGRSLWLLGELGSDPAGLHTRTGVVILSDTEALVVPHRYLTPGEYHLVFTPAAGTPFHRTPEATVTI